jgi:hypothetical protein
MSLATAFSAITGPPTALHALRALQLCLASLAVLGTLLAAVFGFWSTIQTKAEQSVVQAWFHSRWHSVRRTKWRDVPRRLIGWMQDLGTFFHVFSNRESCQRVVVWLSIGGLISLPVLPFYAHASSQQPTLLMLAYAALSAIATVIFRFSYRNYTSSSSRYVPGPRWLIYWILYGVISSFPFLIGLVDMHFCMTTPPPLSFLLTGVVGASFSGMMLYVSTEFMFAFRPEYISSEFASAYKLDFGPYIESIQKKAFSAGFLWTFSVISTEGALFVGYVFGSQGQVPNSLQLVASNCVFDALTLVCTITLLRAGTAHQNRLPILIVASVLLAACLSLPSLGIGVAHSNWALTPRELLRVFIAHSTDGRTWQFGSGFWVMHSTFLPILLYFLTVLIFWLVKVHLALTEWLFGKAHHPDVNPLGITSRFFGLGAAVFGIAAFITRLMLPS